MKFIIFLSFFSAIALAQTVSFDCEAMPDICTNMCWAVHCTAGKWRAQLTYDAVSKTVNRRRRRAAGCMPSPNRCSVKSGYQAGFNCDEYPFASVSESDAGGQSNRCVHTGQNSAQGGTLNAFYRNLAPGTRFLVAFLNPTKGGTKYCTNGANVCVNDGNQHTKAGVQANPPGNRWTPRSLASSGAYLYKTASGKDLSSPELFEIGHEFVTVVPVNQTSYELLLESQDEDASSQLADPDFYTLKTDVIVEKLDQGLGERDLSD
ncbi:hypothetical protein BKA64DRAFT_580300 [Cadophora sp. MPI-SDFR-AT-0126]|nr:hypothetical protein BKA64DRAFT_580300 [Leotiomycetes sp. MPI-SDFR-AT-0126]